MKMRILLLLSVVTWHVTSSNAISIKSASTTFSSRVNAFSSKLFQAIAEDRSGNFVYSPISASLLLSLVAFGAKGETEQQLRAVLEFSRDDDVNKADIRDFITNLANFRDVELYLAHKIFLAKDLDPKARFLDVIKRYFSSKAELVDFRYSAQASKTINDWCEAETNGRIKDVTSASDFDSNTKLVLVNAAFFKGRWASEFNPKRTEQRPFYVNRRRVIDVPTMHGYGSYYTGKLAKINARFVRLAYKNRGNSVDVNMYIILLDENYDVDEVKQNLNELTFDQNLDGRETDLHLYLPKFKIESQINLEHPLRKLGLDDMFNDGADFTGIVEDPPLMVDNIIQKAMIQVDERGTEGAAAFSANTDPTATFNSDVFKVDRPFISVIVTETGVPLFSAMITEPMFE